MMKKIIFALFAILLNAAPASAKSVVFVLNDSTKVYYLLSDNPVIKLGKQGFTVGSDAYQFESFDRFYISNEDEPSAIESIEGTEPKAFNIEEAAVYDLNGRKVADRFSPSDSQLPRGAYILRHAGRSVKIIKK